MIALQRSVRIIIIVCLRTQEYSVQITFREEWKDNRLVYDDLGGQIRYLTLTDPDKVWKPDLFFSNEKEGHFHDIIMPNVLLRIFPDGSILYSIRISLVLACPMDLKYYPLDKQTCDIKMASCECFLLAPKQSLECHSMQRNHKRGFKEWKEKENEDDEGRTNKTFQRERHKLRQKMERKK